MIPFFSVIIPIYNCEKTILETLYSVLSQSYNEYEVIIIDDCSSDASLNEINKIKDSLKDITILNNNYNLGVAESRNKGIKIAKGNYITFLDGDDIWMSDKLEKQKLAIDKTNCDICCTSYSFVNENSNDIKRTYIIPEFINYKMLLKQNYIGCSTVAIKRKLAINNLMDKKYQHEDYALWLKLARDGANIVGIKDSLVKYRISNKSRSFNKAKAAKGRMSIYINQEKLNLIKSFYYFSYYAISGIKKKLL